MDARRLSTIHCGRYESVHPVARLPEVAALPLSPDQQGGLRWDACFLPGSRKLLRPTPTKRKRCCGSRFTRWRRVSAILVNSSQVAGGDGGV